VLRDANAVLFTCEQERQLARESFWLYRANERVVSLGIAAPPSDVEAQRARFYGEFPECRDRRLVLFLGRIHEKKGCDLLLEAYARVADRDPKLLLVMAGPEHQDTAEWRALATKLGIADRVLWTGMLGSALKWGALRCAEVFALPSHQENFGIAVVEALACGVPVLLSTEVNIWREIIDAGAGLAEKDTVAGATRLLERWLDMSPEDQQRMRARALECFRQSFEIGNATENLLAVLRNGNGGSS
jgi:glycosyltransferase involved in cell wall biosynthesis